jgi:hypothetical protein
MDRNGCHQLHGPYWLSSTERCFECSVLKITCRKVPPTLTSGFKGVNDAVLNRRDMTPEEKFFFQNVGLLIHAAGRRNNAVGLYKLKCS